MQGLRQILNPTINSDFINMSKISFQFHSLPEELPWLVDQISEGAVLTAYVIRRSSQKIEKLNIPCSSGLIGHASKIIFLFEPAILEDVATENFLHKASPLVLEPGELTEGGLKESWIYAMCDDLEIIKKWRRVVKRLSGQMITNIVAKSPSTGTTVKLKGHRFTVGARDAALAGIKMLPVAGNSLLLPS